MSYTIIHNWGWFKHQDCRNAYSIHADECRIALMAENNLRNRKIQDYATNIASLEIAIEECLSDAKVRFTDTLKEFGFKQMLKICKCAKERK